MTTQSRGGNPAHVPFAWRLCLATWSGLALLGADPLRADTPCSKPSDVEMVQLLNRWRTEFTSGNTDRLLALYSDDATLVPTRNAQPYKGKDAIRTYYADLLSHHPNLSITPSTMTAGCNTAVISGPVIYRLKGDRKGTRSLLGGRATTEFALQNGTWQIVRQSLAADPRVIGDPLDKGTSPL